MPDDSVDCSSYNETYTPKSDTELLDSATSITTAKCNKESIVDILDSVSEILCCINHGTFGLKGSTLERAKNILLNSELVLSSFAQRGVSPLKHLLVDELETLGGILGMNFGVKDSKEENQILKFALDTILEYLDSRFGRYPEPGAKVSTKLPLCVNTTVLLFEIVEEVRKWGALSRFVHDDLVEREMSLSLNEWTRFDAESYETGLEISRQVFHILVDEIVVDLWS